MISTQTPFVLAVVASGLLAAGISGCSRGQADSTATPETVVYFDTATQQTLSLPDSGEWPATHPETGKRTLVPARHCSQCDRWHASPPLDVLQREPQARNCPYCGQPVQSSPPAAEDS